MERYTVEIRKPKPGELYVSSSGELKEYKKGRRDRLPCAVVVYPNDHTVRYEPVSSGETSYEWKHCLTEYLIDRLPYIDYKHIGEVVDKLPVTFESVEYGIKNDRGIIIDYWSGQLDWKAMYA